MSPPASRLAGSQQERAPTAHSKPIQEVIAPKDAEFLEAREKIIDSGRKVCLEVGRALLEIRDYQEGLLYGAYGTFEDYCRERWEFGRSYAYRLIAAAEIFEELSPRGDKAENTPLPTTEKQIRSLRLLESASERQRAWEQAVQEAKGGPVYARHVSRAVRKLLVRKGVKSKEQSRRRTSL